VLIRRRQPSPSTAQSFCLTFNHRLVGPPSYTLASSFATQPSYPRSITWFHPPGRPPRGVFECAEQGKRNDGFATMREQQFAVELRSSVSPLSLPLDLPHSGGG
jgi:hypothetical protein